MNRVLLLSLCLPLSLACSTPGASSAEPGDEPSPSGMQMPAAGEYLPVSDPRYGYLAVAPNAPMQGEQAPDFELPTHTGGSLKLSDALAEGPVVLMFYRGFW